MEVLCIKVMFLTLENPEWQAVFLKKGNSIVIRKQCAKNSCLYKECIFP
jgi:hypothetical protein